MLSGENETWDAFEANVINKINALVYPKKLNGASENDKEARIVFNKDNKTVKLERAQYFIDLPIAGHILSVLWVLTVGLKMDNRNEPDSTGMYEHSYGNRLRKTLINPDTGHFTCSPNLFEPYFSQYESWRDKALEYAEKMLENKQDVIILTLDLKSFYYSVDIEKEVCDGLLFHLKKCDIWNKRVHDFVYKVLLKYSEIVREINTDEELRIEKNTILPIGFLPSLILSNWMLKPFDNDLITYCNPVYYGRYVDDIIIVDKVEKNSPLHELALKKTDEDKLTALKVIEYYFCQCSAYRTIPTNCVNRRNLFNIVHENEKTASQKCRTIYRINPEICSGEFADIQIQSEKVSVFYFFEGGNKALLDCFRVQIAKNVSEFRYLPDIDIVRDKNAYNELFCLSNKGDFQKLNNIKLNNITGVALDKFSLSKFLGKFRKITGMIRDKSETVFEKKLLTIFDKRSLIENHSLWERLLEIMIVNNRLDNYEKLIARILDAITELDIPTDKVNKMQYDSRKALICTLHSAICRTAALMWGKSIEQTMGKVWDMISKKLRHLSIDIEVIESFSVTQILQYRINYCSTKMVNKYVIPIPIDCIRQSFFDVTDSDICLFKLEDVISHISDKWRKLKYSFYPYMVTPQEISFALVCQNIADSTTLSDPGLQYEHIDSIYQNWNYTNLIGEKNYDDRTNSALNKIKIKKFKDKTGSAKRFATSVDSGVFDKLKVAIGNAWLDEKDFQKALTGKTNRSSKRYQQLSTLLHAAISERVDILVLPENYLPWEWMPDIARLCANNQMGLITGIEHIVSPKNGKVSEGQRKAYNLTAVILPYLQEDYKYAYVTYHHKVHYSPKEKTDITGNHLIPFEGKYFHLFQWRDVWFSVYCCFELASIQGRAMFQSLADLTVAVEWNRDIAYFGSIMESLCRDLHCFCIQVNSSDYGDSRLMSPSRTEKRDIIKTKGGKNSAIFVEEIDISALREFQRMGYELQSQNDMFKHTPPDFEPKIPTHKQNGTLWEYIK